MNEAYPLSVWRERAGLTQQDMAVKLSVTRWTVNSIETGRRKPSPALVGNIEAITGISRHELRPDIFGPPTNQ